MVGDGRFARQIGLAEKEIDYGGSARQIDNG
jgi:hypothetical protein